MPKVKVNCAKDVDKVNLILKFIDLLNLSESDEDMLISILIESNMKRRGFDV